MFISEVENEQDFDRKGSLIKKYAKKNFLPSQKEINVVEKYLSHEDYYLRESATYALFFMWELVEERLINKALKILINENEDFDVRKWVFSGFPTIYKKINDKRIPQYIYNVFRFSKDESVRKLCLKALLEIYGIDSKEILLKEVENNIHFNKGTIEDRIELFSKELLEIEQLLSDRTNTTPLPHE